MKIEAVVNGFVEFAEDVLLPAMNPTSPVEKTRAWSAAFGLGFIRGQPEVAANMLVEYLNAGYPYLLALVMDDDRNVNTDALLSATGYALKAQGSLELDIPMFGKFTLGQAAFEKLGEYIKTQAN